MGRKRRRKRRKNPIRRIFALINKFIRHLQRSSEAPKKIRRRQKKRSKNLISPIFALSSKFLSNHQQNFVKSDSKPISQVRRRRSRRRARLEIRSHDRNIKITRIQE